MQQYVYFFTYLIIYREKVGSYVPRIPRYTIPCTAVSSSNSTHNQFEDSYEYLCNKNSTSSMTTVPSETFYI